MGKGIWLLRVAVILSLVLLLITLPILGGCGKKEEKTPPPTPKPVPTAGIGTVEVRATDAPPAGVSNIMVTVRDIEIHKADAPENSWVSVVDEQKTFDLVEIQGAEVFLGKEEVQAGQYTQIRLDVTKVLVTLEGKEIPAGLPGDKLKVVRSWQVEPGEKTILTLDFDADKFVVITGKDRAQVKPVIKLQVTQGDRPLKTPKPKLTPTPEVTPKPTPTPKEVPIPTPKPTPAPKPTPEPAPTKSYQNSEHGFALSYPDEWSEAPPWSPTAIFSLVSPDQKARVEIDAEYKTEETTLDAYVAFIKSEYFKPEYEVRILSEGDTTLEDGTPAYQMLYTEKLMGTTYKAKTVIIVRRTQCLGIYGMAPPADFDANQKDIDQILASFRVLPLEVIPTPTPTPSEAGFYEDKEHGFSINYPKEWNELPPRSNEVLFSIAAPVYFPGVQVVLMTVEEGKTPAEIGSEFPGQISKVYSDFELVSQGEIKLKDGTLAYEVTYTGAPPGSGILGMKVVFVVRGTECFWLQGYSSPENFAEHEPLIDEVIQSFQLAPSAEGAPTPRAEEIDESTFARNFTKIYLTHLPRPGESPTEEMMRTPVTAFEASETGVNMMISTTPAIDPSVKVIVKIFEVKTNVLLHEGPFKTTLKPSHTLGEAFPMGILKGPGEYQIRFYADGSLVKIIDFEVIATPILTPVPGKADILSHTSYMKYGSWKEIFSGKTYEGDFLHVVGEIQNSGAVNLKDFKIGATYFDSNGAVLDAGPTHLEHDPRWLAPGEKAPFLLILLDEEASKEVARYELVLEFNETTEAPYELNTFGDRGYVNKWGTYNVIGEVQNAGERNIESVKLYATFYDENGRVIDIDYTYTGATGLDMLAPGQKSSFKLYPGRSDVKGQVQGYSLHADCKLTDRVIYRGFQILSQNSRVGTLGDYIVEGEIKNVGDQDAKFVQIVATFYGTGKKVVAADSTFADPRDLKAGEIGQFKLSTYEYKASAEVEPVEIESYQLEFECSVY